MLAAQFERNFLIFFAQGSINWVVVILHMDIYTAIPIDTHGGNDAKIYISSLGYLGKIAYLREALIYL